MKSAVGIATIAVFATAALAPSSVHAQTTVVVAKDCMQVQRQTVNKLLEQDVNPFKACAMVAKSDIVTIATSRLCPIAECKLWLAYMAANAPDCVYDDTNYGEEFKLKSKDCDNVATNTGASTGGDTNAVVNTKKPETKSTDGSAAGADAVANTPKPTTTPPVSSAASADAVANMKEPATTPPADAGVNTPKPATLSPAGSAASADAGVNTPKPTTKSPVGAAADEKTARLTTKAPVTPPPSSATSLLPSGATSLCVASALCAMPLAVAAFEF